MRTLWRCFGEKALIDAQAGLLRDGVSGSDACAASVAELESFDLPWVGALRRQPEGSLLIRHGLLASALWHLLGHEKPSRRWLRRAREALEACTASGLFAEGWDRFQGCLQARDFWEEATGQICHLEFGRTYAEYGALLSPEGSLPVTLTARADLRAWFPPRAATSFSTDFYSVFRFEPDTYLMVMHDASLVERGGNPACPWDFGHFVLFSRGRWRVAPSWEIAPAERGDALNVFRSGWETRKPHWRSARHHLRVMRHGPRHLELRCGSAVRHFRIHEKYLDVEDRGGEASVFNFDHDGYANAFHWSWQGTMRFHPAPTTGSIQARLYGESRAARFWY